MSLRSCGAYTAIILGAWTACTDFGSSNPDASDDAAVPSSTDGGDSGLEALDGTFPALRVSLAVPLPALVRGRPTVVAEIKVEPVGVDAEVVVEGLPTGAPRTLAPVNAATGIAKIPIEAPAGSAPASYDITFKASSRTTPSSGTLTTKLTVRGAPGELDETFGVGGRALEPPDTLVVYDATLLAGGQLVLAGKDDIGPLLRRFNPDGSRDTSFGDQGTARVAGPLLGDGFYQVTPAADGLRAVFASYAETTVYRVDGAGKNSVVRSFPRSDFSGPVTTNGPSGSNRFVLGGTRNDGRWVLASIDATSGTSTAWGSGGFVHESGDSSTAFAYFEDGATSHAFVSRFAGDGVFDVKIDAAGTIIGKLPITGVTRLPIGFARIGPADYVLQRTDFSMVRWNGSQATPFGEAPLGIVDSTSITTGPKARFLRRSSGGFLLLAAGSEEVAAQLTGPLFLKLCMLSEDGKGVPSFGIAGCQKLELKPQTPRPGHSAIAVFATEDGRALIIGSFGTPRTVGIVRMWL